MSKFDTVRARWEMRRTDHSEDSLTIPLLNAADRAPSPRQKAAKSTQSSASRRITTGFGVLNRPLTSIRNRVSNRASRQTSSDSKQTDEEPPKGKPPRPALKGQLGGGGKQHAKTKMVKSQTMSFLPVPRKLSSPLPAPARPQIKPANSVPAIPQTRIPSPPKSSRPKVLPRSSTQPIIGFQGVTPRKGSELARKASSRWPLLEGSSPLLSTPLLESPVETPPCSRPYNSKRAGVFFDAPDDDSEYKTPRQATEGWSMLAGPKVSTPRRINVGKENVPNPSTNAIGELTPRSRSYEVQHHQLLQPIQPLSPARATLPSVFLNGSPRAIGTTAVRQAVASDSRPVFTNRQDMRRPAPLDLSPTRAKPRSKPMREPEVVPVSAKPPVHLIPEGCPNTYWSGRFTSLNDRLLNEAFDTAKRPIVEEELCSSEESLSSLALAARDGDKHRKPDAEEQRAAEVFAQLKRCCTTVEARRSLAIFQNMYAIRMRWPDMRCEIPQLPGGSPKISVSSSRESCDEIGTAVDVAGAKAQSMLATAQAAKGAALGDSVGSTASNSSGKVGKMSFMQKLRKASGKSMLSMGD